MKKYWMTTSTIVGAGDAVNALIQGIRVFKNFDVELKAICLMSN